MPSTGISLAKLNTGSYYHNQTFGTNADPERVEIIGLLLGYLPHFQQYNPFNMNNLYLRYLEGIVINIRLKLDIEGEINYI